MPQAEKGCGERGGSPCPCLSTQWSWSANSAPDIGSSLPELPTIHSKLGAGTSNDRAHDRVRTMLSVLPNPPRPPNLTLAPPLSHSLLVEGENRVNPGGSQRRDQAREYGNRNQEQR